MPLCEASESQALAVVLSLDSFIVSSQLCFTYKKAFIASLPQQAAIFNGITLPYPTFSLHNLRNLKKRGLIVRFLGAIFRSHSKNRAESVWRVHQRAELASSGPKHFPSRHSAVKAGLRVASIHTVTTLPSHQKHFMKGFCFLFF